MNKLRKFIEDHCQKVELGNGDIDIEFFSVRVLGEPNVSDLKELVESNKKGEFNTRFDLFDGNEHGYITLGGWIGDQGYALMLMALGAHLKLWDLLTPTILMPFLDESTRKQMSGMGMVSIVHKS